METISASECLSLQSSGTRQKVKERVRAAITEASQPNSKCPSPPYPTFASFTQSIMKYNEATQNTKIYAQK